jgi:Icc protein
VLGRAFADHPPDVLLVTGDIAHDPTDDVYAQFLETVRAYHSGPMLCVAGNHDLWAPMVTAGLPLAPVSVGKWTFVGLDSHIDDEVSSQVTDRDVTELISVCPDSSSDQHTLVVTHHPVVTVNCPWLDKDRIQNAEDLLESLADQTTVRAFVFGHVHQEVAGDAFGIDLLGTPSTCFQFGRNSERFTIGPEQPGYRWFDLYPDGRVVSAVERVACAFEIDLTQRG